MFLLSCRAWYTWLHIFSLWCGNYFLHGVCSTHLLSYVCLFSVSPACCGTRLFSYFTVRGITIFSRENQNENEKNEFSLVKSWTRKEVLRDIKFYTILPAILAPAFIITGIVINQSFIIDSKGWGEYAIAKAFMIYSVLTVLTLFFSGLLVDKFTNFEK